MVTKQTGGVDCFRRSAHNRFGRVLEICNYQLSVSCVGCFG